MSVALQLHDDCMMSWQCSCMISWQCSFVCTVPDITAIQSHYSCMMSWQCSFVCTVPDISPMSAIRRRRQSSNLAPWRTLFIDSCRCLPNYLRLLRPTEEACGQIESPGVLQPTFLAQSPSAGFDRSELVFFSVRILPCAICGLLLHGSLLVCIRP